MPSVPPTVAYRIYKHSSVGGGDERHKAGRVRIAAPMPETASRPERMAATARAARGLLRAVGLPLRQASGSLAQFAAIRKLRPTLRPRRRHYAKLLRATLTAVLLLLGVAGVAVAGKLEDAKAAI